jgi:hypothetical protein
MIYYELSLVIFAFLVFLIYTDPTAAPYFNLIFKESWVNIRRWIFIARMYPRIKFDMWMIKRRAAKIKREHERS